MPMPELSLLQVLAHYWIHGPACSCEVGKTDIGNTVRLAFSNQADESTHITHRCDARVLRHGQCSGQNDAALGQQLLATVIQHIHTVVTKLLDGDDSRVVFAANLNGLKNDIGL